MINEIDVIFVKKNWDAVNNAIKRNKRPNFIYFLYICTHDHTVSPHSEDDAELHEMQDKKMKLNMS